MGGSMRIVKPSSANNSPRSSMSLGRRRTVMNDGAYRRRAAMMDQSLLAASGYISNDGLQHPPQQRSSRPVSWHPASHLMPQQYQQSYNIPTPDPNNQYNLFTLPSTPAVHSGYASPDSTFSPLSVPYTGYEQHQCFQNPPPMPTPEYLNQPQFVQPYANLFPLAAQDTDPSMYSHFDWNNFATNGFVNSTAPPTPDNFLPIQYPEPAFPAEEAIPYHSLEDNESDDGEELIGMGLYDTPEFSKSSLADPQLNSYRAMMMSQLAGSGYALPRKLESEGKGLKLEETWTPPSDIFEEDDDEQDGEGEKEEPEVKFETSAALPQQSHEYYLSHQAYSRAGWL